ncbi:MAG: DUF4330 domain-containing protein [Candidatus Gastranaerophilaceae bacterium]|nr:DUF4330 domain-containing protein [Candidatus Gastranaerophilaceae bacterium]
MEKFEFLKKIRPFDLIVIVGVVIALIVGFLTFKHFRQTADKQIETTNPIVFDVYLRGITLTGGQNPIHTGDKTFISIRNVPYSDLEIINVKTERRHVVLPMINNVKSAAKNVLVSEDVSQPNVYDIVVTLTDTAKITKDGAVVGGNKVKMGLPITLEGMDYKFNGTVADITVTHDDIKDDINSSVNKVDNVQ